MADTFQSAPFSVGVRPLFSKIVCCLFLLLYVDAFVVVLRCFPELIFQSSHLRPNGFELPVPAPPPGPSHLCRRSWARLLGASSFQAWWAPGRELFFVDILVHIFILIFFSGNSDFTHSNKFKTFHLLGYLFTPFTESSAFLVWSCKTDGWIDLSSNH